MAETPSEPGADLEAVVDHYGRRYEEAGRLVEGPGRLELLRTQEVIRRHLPSHRLNVLDVGGGTGVHALWLAEDGHDVELIDPVVRHVEAAARIDPTRGSLRARLGEARQLECADESFDVVLLLGPLYHLQERPDRVRALEEATRVLRPGGLLFAAAISRFASLHDGLSREFLFDPEFRSIVTRDLETGRHENPGGHDGWFTTAYFHRPEELREEVAAAGLELRALVGLEGLGGWLPHLDARWSDPATSEIILTAARAVESEPSLMGLSAHLLAVAARPS
jgi:ubiquinone/menaquinone biosynthesis C-methylase UbiE